MLKLDGKTLDYDKAFSHNNINYPRNWLNLTTLEEKKAIGITEEADPVIPSYDRRFYWGVDKPKDIDQLKVKWVNHQKATAGGLLCKTDWMIIRKAETSTAVPSDTTTYRTAVRDQCKKREDQITACSDTKALDTLINTGVGESGGLAAWPTEP